MTYAADKYAYSTSSSTDFKEYTRVYFQNIELYRTMQSYLEEFRKTIHCVFVECFARHWVCCEKLNINEIITYGCILQFSKKWFLRIAIMCFARQQIHWIVSRHAVNYLS